MWLHSCIVASGAQVQEAHFRIVIYGLTLFGGFRTARGMARAVEEYGIDLTGIARPMVFEPDLPYKILSGKVVKACDVPVIGKNVFEQLSWFQEELRIRVEVTGSSP
jgi:2,4-dienoyl-CoA reductase-like NADH-dependent reductase (Old Yellow Enzyme family)